MTTNLYSVCAADYEWSCFVFDTSRNKAKLRAAERFGEDYINMRCKTLKRGVNYPFSLVVDCETDEGYEMVLQCGFRYMTEEDVWDEYD